MVHGNFRHTLEDPFAHFRLEVPCIGLAYTLINLIRDATSRDFQQNAGVCFPLSLVTNHHCHIERHRLDFGGDVYRALAINNSVDVNLENSIVLVHLVFVDSVMQHEHYSHVGGKSHLKDGALVLDCIT